MVDQAIKQEMDRPLQHHLEAAPLQGMNVVGEIAALHGPVIDHRKVHEAEVRQQEKVAERVDQGFPRLGMFQFIKINNHSEHKH